MEQTWRWFGPKDPIPLAHVKQAGATGIVSALHDHYRGEVWPEDAIAERRAVIEAAGLRWSVVESIPVPNAIKLGGDPAREATAAFAETMRRLARAGLSTICYNFMPVVDWTRTQLRHPMPSGGLALRFDMIDFVAYDAFILDRPDADRDYTPGPPCPCRGARLLPCARAGRGARGHHHRRASGRRGQPQPAGHRCGDRTLPRHEPR